MRHRTGWARALRLSAGRAAALVALVAAPATAATITVTSLLDDNVGCTLRNAIASSNDGTSHGGCAAGGAFNTILFASSGTIALAGPPLNIYHNSLAIAGNGTAATIIDAQNLDRVFDNLDPGVPAAISITWQNLTIKRGNALSAGPTAMSSAGAIFVDTLTTASISSCVLSANHAESSGGAIENWGSLTITGSTFDANVSAGEGGAIRSIGTLSISDSTFSNNSSNSGGAVWHSTGSLSQALAIVNGTFAGNSAAAFGGAISADDATSAGPVTLTQVTVAGNAAGTGTGGGVYMNNGAAFAIDRSIVASNSASVGPDCGVGAAKSLNSLDYNVLGSLAGCTVGGTIAHNVVTAAPQLGALASNGGPTRTVALLTGSPAIDIAPTCATGFDQRGVARPIGAGCDAGAFELQMALALSPASLPSGQAGVAYSQTFTASNGTGPYSFAVTAGTLPAGLALSSAGALTGTPGGGGSFSFTVTVTDTFSSATGSFGYTLNVAALPGGLFRAYVSSNGNDANPCTLAAPCRLLPAALAAVSNPGEVWLLDSANFNTGVVDITKSVTIVAAPGTLGSVVANNADAIHVNTAGVQVTLRGLAVLNLSGAGNNGIQFNQGAQLTVENCEIFGLATGISAGAPGGLLVVKGSTIRDNTTQGVSLQGPVLATIDQSLLAGNASFGLIAQGGAKARVSRSAISGSATGASAAAAAGTSTQLTLSATQLSGNGTALGVSAAAGGDTAQAMLDDVTIAQNATGVALSGSGTKTVFTRQNNAFRFNGADVTGGTLTPLAGQ